MAFLNEVSYRHSIRNPRKNLFNFNTPEGNYWIGFLLADGHINVDSDGSLKVYQYIGNKSNIDHFLEYVKDSSTEVIGTFNMSKTGDVVYIPNNPDINKLVKTFDWKNNMKKCPNIEKIIKYFNKLNFNNSLAFICGFIDGDGSIKNEGNCIIEIKSNWEKLLKAFQEKLNLYDRKIGKRKEDSGKDAVYMNIPLNIMKRIDGIIQSKGPRWDRVNPIEESFDFDSDDDYELGQPIIDRYKTIQTLEDLISKFVYSHYPNNKNVVTPGVVLDSFIWRFFPSYYNSDNDFIEGLSYDVGDKCKMTIIHAGEDFERHERKRIKIEFPKKSTRKSFVEECSRKMAEGLVDAGIDMKHINIMEALSETFDFDESNYDFSDIVNNKKILGIFKRALVDSGFLSEISSDGMIKNPATIINEFVHHCMPYYWHNPKEFILSMEGDDIDKIVLSVVHSGTAILKENSRVIDIEVPIKISVKEYKDSIAEKIAKVFVDVGADVRHLKCRGNELHEAFDFNNDDEDDQLDFTVNTLKRIALLSSRINDEVEYMKERLEGVDHSMVEGVSFLVNIIFHLFSHMEDPYEAVDFTSEGAGNGYNYTLYVPSKNHIGKPIESSQKVYLPMMIDVSKNVSSYVRSIAKALVELDVDEIYNLFESFDFDNGEDYDLGIDKISTYYKLLEKELDFLLDSHAGPKGKYNVALMLSLFLQRIGLVASEITVSNVKYPKGTIHFSYDETNKNYWKSLISGNREETKDEIRRMLSDILKDEEVFYDLTEIIKENKLNESFDFDIEDNYEQELDDKVSKIRKFQEWNFVNGFKILENFYSMGLKKDPNMKVYAYPSTSLLINILYPIDKTLHQGDTREVRVTISENQSRNNGTGLYFRNNKTGKISYKVFPYEYTVKEFKDKWSYLVIEALEEIGASKSTLMRKNDSLYEAFDFSNDNEDSLLAKISEIALIRKIVEMFEERAKESFKNYFGSDSKEIYTTNAYNVYLDKIKDYINEKSGKWFGIGTSLMKNNYYTMDIKVMNADGGEFVMEVPHKVSFEELTDEEFPRLLKAIMDNMPEYKEILLNNF